MDERKLIISDDFNYLFDGEEEKIFAEKLIQYLILDEIPTETPASDTLFSKNSVNFGAVSEEEIESVRHSIVASRLKYIVDHFTKSEILEILNILFTQPVEDKNRKTLSELLNQKLSGASPKNKHNQGTKTVEPEQVEDFKSTETSEDIEDDEESENTEPEPTGTFDDYFQEMENKFKKIAGKKAPSVADLLSSFYDLADSATTEEEAKYLRVLTGDVLIPALKRSKEEFDSKETIQSVISAIKQAERLTSGESDEDTSDAEDIEEDGGSLGSIDDEDYSDDSTSKDPDEETKAELIEAFTDDTEDGEIDIHTME